MGSRISGLPICANIAPSFIRINAANETAVYAFLEDKIAFGDIYKVVTSVLESMGPEDDFTLDNLLSIDRWAREKATSLML